jgi:hypothetical protein
MSRKPTPFVKSIIPAHLHHLRDQLPAETLQMFEINRVIQDLSEVIEFNDRIEKSFKNQTINSKLEDLLSTKESATENDLTINGAKLGEFLDKLYQTLDFWAKERIQVRKIWDGIKNIGYYLEQDPINEKIKSANQTIVRLKNRCQ